MAASLSSLNDVLKESYVVDDIKDQLNNDTRLWQDFAQGTVNWTGKDCIMPLRIGRNSGIGAVAENGTLPTAGQQTYAKLSITAKGVYGSAGITGFAFAAAANTSGVFPGAVQFESEMNNLIEDVRKIMLAYLLFGNDFIGFVWQKQNAAVWQYSGRLDNTEDPFAGVNVGVGRTVQFFRLDTYVAVGAATQVNSIVTTAGIPTLTTNAAINTAAVPVNVLLGVKYVTGVGTDRQVVNEPKGFFANLSDPDHFGEDRSTAGPAVNAQLRSNFRLSDPGAPAYNPLTLAALQSIMSTAERRSGKKFDKFVCAIEQIIAYTNLLQGTSAGNLRVDVKDGKRAADAGFTSWGYGDIPFQTVDLCPIGTIFGVNNSGYKKAVLSPGEWIDYNGIIKQVDGLDAGVAQWRMYYDLVCDQPNAQAALTAVEIPD